MTPAYSPAPWYRPTEREHNSEVYVAETEGHRDQEMIAEVGPGMRDDEALANACLIEISPLLFEAAEAVLTNYGYYGSDMEWGLPEHHPLTALHNAIAKYETGLKRGREVAEEWRLERLADTQKRARECREIRGKAYRNLKAASAEATR